MTACSWACHSLLPPPLQVTRQVSSLCTPRVVGTLNEFVRPGGSSGDKSLKTRGRPGIPVLSALGSPPGRRAPPGTPAGSFPFEMGLFLVPHPMWYWQQRHTKNRPGIVALGVSSQHHQALSSAARVRLGERGCPPSRNSIKMALFGGIYFYSERSAAQSTEPIYQ